MPTLKLIDVDSSIPEFADFEVFSKMLFPNDENRSNAFLASIVVGETNRFVASTSHEEKLKKAWETKQITDDFNAFLNAINTQASFSVIRDVLLPFGGINIVASLTGAAQITEAEVNERWCRGMVAGSVMNLIGYLDQVNPPASVNKAIYIEESHLENHPVCPNIIGRSDKVIWKAWSEFKSVAHLWGACCCWGTRIDINDYMSWMKSQESFLYFLDIAKWFQRAGLSIIPKSKSDPILEENTIWKIPNELQIEEVIIRYEEEKWISELIEKYRAPKRLV